MSSLDPQLLVAHGEFVRSVVRAVLKDEHLAEDAVQETWLAALRRPPARSAAWRAWLGRVGRNTAITFVRGRARRRAREAAAARPEAICTATDRLERAQEVVAAVMALPEPLRTAVVERFLEGLRATEIAQRHGVTPATVRNRLRQAVRLLRTELDRHHGAAWPALFLPLAGRTEAGTAAAGAASLLTGGLIMKGKLLIPIALVAGLGIGWIVAPRVERAVPRSETLQTARVAAEAERQRLHDRNRALEKRVAELEDRLRGAGAEHESAADGPKAETERAEASDPAGIDWARLEAAVVQARATLHLIAEAERSGETHRALSPEDQAVAQELILQWNAAAAKARTLTPHPMLDGRFLPKILVTVVGGTLGLSEAQRRRIEQEMGALLETVPDATELTPLEAYGLRRKVLAEAGARVDSLLDGSQKAAWDALGPIWNDLQEGNLRTARVGLRAGVRAQVSRELARHYRLTEEQAAKAGPMVDRYLAEGREVLRRFGQLGDAPAKLDGESRARLQGTLFELQRQLEKELLPLLTPEQRSELRHQIPVLLELEDSGDINIQANDDRGF